MIPLTFRNYSFASLPSGTYLFFPLVTPRETRTPRLVNAYDDADRDCEPSRLVVSTVYDRECELYLSGVAEGKTIYVTLETREFEKLQSALQANGRSLRQEPITFGVELTPDGTVKGFEYDGEPVRQGLPPAVESGAALRSSADGAAAQAARSSA